MNSNGILNSGGVGLTMAEWMIDGAPSRGMGPMLARRAHPFQANTKYNYDRSAESVGFHYGVSWIGRQIHSARGVRRVPLHDRLKAAGATFAERIGWEVPMYYDPEGKGWNEEPNLWWKDWAPHVEAECLAARDAPVLIDQSMYAKIQVQGPDAVKALNRVCGAQMDVAVGVSDYTQFLNARGGIEADVTVTRTAPECFMVITGHPSQIRDQCWIRDHADPVAMPSDRNRPRFTAAPSQPEQVSIRRRDFKARSLRTKPAAPSRSCARQAGPVHQPGAGGFDVIAVRTTNEGSGAIQRWIATFVGECGSVLTSESR